MLPNWQIADMAREKAKKRLQNAPRTRKIECASVLIADTAKQIRILGAKRWEVASQSVAKKWYLVDLTENGFKCECKFHESRNGSRCKHIIAVEVTVLRAEQSKRERQDEEPSKSIVMGRIGYVCPRCRSDRYSKNGTRRCKRKGRVQRFKCEECGRRFSANLGFEGLHIAAGLITLALMLFAIGTTTSGIREVLIQRGVFVHKSTVQKWADEYAGLVKGYTDTLTPPRIGSRWSTDEKFKKIRGQDRWLFAVMDSATRFILSYHMSPIKQNYDATSLLRAAKEKVGFTPKILVSDGLQSFKTACKRAYLTLKKTIIHIREIHLQNRYCNNNAHERLNSELAECLKVRDLKKDDSSRIQLAIIHHSFVRSHQGLHGLTPADVAGICIGGPDKWLVLNQNAALAAA